MNLISMVDKYLETPHLPPEPRHASGWYPSSASCIITNQYGEQEIIGECLRKIFYRATHAPVSNPTTARGMRIMGVGKRVEEFEVEQYKQLGIWRGNNIKFFNPNNNVSGEVDCFVWDEDIKEVIGVELKSGYGYMFQKLVLGTGAKKGTPDYKHLLQVMLYIDYFGYMFKLVYIERGNAARVEYDITLNDDGSPNIDGIPVTCGLTVPNCVARFKQAGEYIKSNTLPPRDFYLKYPQEVIKKLYDQNRLSKTQTTEVERRGSVDMGDWQCSYCDFKEYCWDGYDE